MATTLPDFEDPAWNEKRSELSQALVDAAATLIEHMRPPGGLELHLIYKTESGRDMVLSLKASPPVPKH